MNDKPMQATEPEVLENYIMNPNIAKGESEWWACHEIERLRSKCKNMENILIGISTISEPMLTKQLTVIYLLSQRALKDKS